MADLYKNKYRIASARHPNWDYRWAAAYFITICTHDRNHYFGEINHGKMQLSNVGVIADLMWHEIKNHAKNIELGEFIVMPNHIHGILILNNDPTNDDPTNPDSTNNNPTNNDPTNPDSTNNNPTNNVETGYAVETGHALSLRNALSVPPPPSLSLQSPSKSRFQNPGKNSVSSIIGSYKSAVTKHANRMQYPFKWQTRFHDHIIRNDTSFQNISHYIRNNPKNWDQDKFHH